MRDMAPYQPTSHPLKWAWLVKQMQDSGMDNPDIWIEDVSDYGPCSDVVPERIEYGYHMPPTDCIEASACTTFDRDNNRVIICHHI